MLAAIEGRAAMRKGIFNAEAQCGQATTKKARQKDGGKNQALQQKEAEGCLPQN
jgi:hypothetical protein